MSGDDARGDKWNLTSSGLFVPAGHGSTQGAQTGEALERISRSTASATWATALVAVAAAVVSLLAVAGQWSTDRREAARERRQNAARVQTWIDVDALVIQNSSAMPVSAVFINWMSNGRTSLMAVANFPLAPCTRWTINTKAPEIATANRSAAIFGITFAQDSGIWSVDWVLGTLQGPSDSILKQPKLGVFSWTDKYAKTDAASTCSA